MWKFQDVEWIAQNRAWLPGIKCNLKVGDSVANALQGFVVTDWGALYEGNYLLAGLDMTMPAADGLWNELLVEAVKNGTYPESRVTDMAMRYVS